RSEKIYLVSMQILKKVTGLEAPEPIAAEISLPKTEDFSGKKLIVGLNAINDPGNLGTLLRTALALGWEGAFITKDSVDPFNDKALRAAKGATFKLPLCFGSSHDLGQLIRKNRWHVYAADMAGIPLAQISIKMPLLLLLGNESHGIAENLKKQYELVSIPMSPKMESLNVSMAGAILMYSLKNVS
ncbi:MAG TPA: RNA methyltransferase, partial [Rhabdochlamydiaceae bacterium]|nr:RNA methyltransferase [Rhabdochlamydiaceae bacterium]